MCHLWKWKFVRGYMPAQDWVFHLGYGFGYELISVGVWMAFADGVCLLTIRAFHHTVLGSPQH